MKSLLFASVNHDLLPARTFLLFILHHHLLCAWMNGCICSPQKTMGRSDVHSSVIYIQIEATWAGFYSFFTWCDNSKAIWRFPKWSCDSTFYKNWLRASSASCPDSPAAILNSFFEGFFLQMMCGEVADEGLYSVPATSFCMGSRIHGSRHRRRTAN